MISELWNWAKRGLADEKVPSALVGVLVGAVLTGGTSWLIANQTIDAQKDQAQRAIAEQKEQEVREKRSAVYENFQKASHAWVYTRAQQVACNCVASKVVFDANEEFRNQIVDVRIFGSTEAYDAATAVGESIPDTWPGLGGPIAVDSRKPFDDAAYANADGNFVKVMCRELPAIRSGQC